jgi:hypothetical protein
METLVSINRQQNSINFYIARGARIRLKSGPAIETAQLHIFENFEPLLCATAQDIPLTMPNFTIFPHQKKTKHFILQGTLIK